jgi:hypothetical protein
VSLQLQQCCHIVAAAENRNNENKNKNILQTQALGLCRSHALLRMPMQESSSWLD